MKESLLGATARREGDSRSSPTSADVEADAVLRTVGVPRRGSLTSVRGGGTEPLRSPASPFAERSQSTPPRALDIEDALDEIGGVGRYQLWHFFILGSFWFWNFGASSSTLANGPYCAVNTDCDTQCGVAGGSCLCRDGPDDCCGGDDFEPCEEGREDDCLDEGLTWAARTAGCTVPDEQRGGGAQGEHGMDEWWSDCASVSCQFNLAPALGGGPDSGRVYIRSLFDTSFFLGWLWAVPISGLISDRYGRRTALIIATSVANVAYIVAALAPNAPVYALARHFSGVGTGSTSLTAYVLGTEYCPRTAATTVKSVWSVFSVVGTGTIALLAWAMTAIPGYNWRVLSLLGMTPNFIMSIVAYACVDESPRWTLVTKGEEPARALLRKVARRNGQRWVPVRASQPAY
jgi:hypothetical protein